MRHLAVLPLILLAACEGRQPFDRSMARRCADTDSCGTRDEPIEMSFDGDGRPTFHRAGGEEFNEEFMTHLSVDRPHVREGGDRTACDLTSRNWGGTMIWSIEFEPGEVPVDVPYGTWDFDTEVSVEPEPLEDGVFYTASWGSCSCFNLWWTQGEDRALRSDECE